jgi:hypothetical protein
MVKCLKDSFNIKMIKNMYHPHFQSRLKYGILFWGQEKGSLKVFRIQKNVLRSTAGVNRCVSYRYLFKQYEILTVASLYIVEVLCFTIKLDINLKHNFEIHRHNT